MGNHAWWKTLARCNPSFLGLEPSEQSLAQRDDYIKQNPAYGRTEKSPAVAGDFSIEIYSMSPSVKRRERIAPGWRPSFSLNCRVCAPS